MAKETPPTIQTETVYRLLQVFLSSNAITRFQFQYRLAFRYIHMLYKYNTNFSLTNG